MRPSAIQGPASRKVSKPSSSGRWRRMQRISSDVMPSFSRPAASAARIPSVAVAKGMPRAVWPWGS